MIAARRFGPTATTSAPFMLPNVTVAKMPRLSNSAQMRYSPAKLRWYLLIFMRFNNNQTDPHNMRDFGFLSVYHACWSSARGVGE